MTRFIKIGEFAKRINRSPQTVRRWEKEGVITSVRTAGNQRLYDANQINQILGLKPEETQRKIIAYARVSTSSQRPDLKNQVQFIEDYCRVHGIIVTDWVEEIGGGMNFRRKKFTNIIDMILEGKVNTLIVAHKDRLTRFGYDLIEQVASKCGTELVVINLPSASPEQEVVEDLMTVIHSFSSRLYGLRKYARKIREDVKTK